MADQPMAGRPTGIRRDAADTPPALWDDAAARSLPEAARAAGGRLEADGRAVVIPFLAGDYRLDLAARVVTAPPGRRPADFQTALVLVSYLAHAMDIGLAGRHVGPQEINGMFFRGPHALAGRPVAERFAADPAGLTARAGLLGFAPCEAGASFRGLALPRLEIAFIPRPADEEFPAETVWTFDAHAPLHLPLDALWALVNVLTEELTA